jgi:hypothetical protein
LRVELTAIAGRPMRQQAPSSSVLAAPRVSLSTFGGTTAAGVPVFVMSFRKNRRQTSNLSTLPGSTDAALAVKTERLPPYGLPPITAWR